MVKTNRSRRKKETVCKCGCHNAQIDKEMSKWHCQYCDPYSSVIKGKETCTNCGKPIGEVVALSPTLDPKKRKMCLDCAGEEIKGKETVLYTAWECPNLPRMHMVIYDATQSQIDEHLKQCGKETAEEKISHDWTDTSEGKILRDFDNVPVNKMKDFIARSLKDYKRALVERAKYALETYVWEANDEDDNLTQIMENRKRLNKRVLKVLADLSAE